LNNLSSALRDLGDYEGAKPGYLKATEILKEHYGEHHVQYAITLNNLSGVLKNL
jgi:hypothetical protein